MACQTRYYVCNRFPPVGTAPRQRTSNSPKLAVTALVDSPGREPNATMRKFTRTDFNFYLDAALLVLFIALCGCSVIIEFVFPPGPQADGWSLWGRSYDEWSLFRFSLLAIIAAGVLLHLMLHWSWVCGVVASRLGRKKPGAAAHDDPARTLWGVGLLIVVVNVVGAVVAVASLMIQAPTAGP